MCIRDRIGPPLGNIPLQWHKWIKDDLIDELIINQSSCKCPSMWHKLWPMHNGSGYIQNYTDGVNLPPLNKQLKESYLPTITENRTKLYVARQWNQRSTKEESELLNEPSVSGLVFSSFRFDNAKAVTRDNWIA